jgi:PiT family inorganic phosphate transporter
VHNSFLLLVVITTALAFDFTNGFHDSANAVATSIATGALKPRVAVAMSAALNLLGAFLSLAVAATIAKGIVDSNVITLTTVFAGLAGAIAWNLVTWYFGIPSSSSYALIGGVVGATLVQAGGNAVIWSGIMSKVLIPMILAPVIAGACATLGTWGVYRITARLTGRTREHGFRVGQIGSAGLVSMAHGTNDAQKTMGILTLALIANGTIAKSAGTPTWVIVTCALAISLGTYLGGWRIIRTLGKGLIDIESPQGFAAESSSAAVIFASAHFGIPLSTTQVTTGSVLGSGIGKRAPVRWGTFEKMVAAWFVTLPAAGLVSAITYALSENLIGGNAGVAVSFALLVIFSGGLYALSRRTPVNPENVNEEWTGTLVPPSDVAPVPA